MITICCAIIERGNEVLLAKRAKHKENPLLWEFPGGKVEANETFQECIKREIEEEFGFNIDIIAQLEECLDFQHNSRNQLRIIPFVCKDSHYRVISSTDHEEIKWVPVHQLHKYKVTKPDISVINLYLKYYLEHTKCVDKK